MGWFAPISGKRGAQGSAGANGSNGAPGTNGTNGLDGAQGPAGFGTVTPSATSRALGTTFQPNATKAVFVSYSTQTQATNPLLAGSSTATVTLLSDASNPPTTERSRASASSSVGLAVAVAITQTNVAQLTYIVPPGHFVRLVSTTSGTASTSIVSQVEETLG